MDTESSSELTRKALLKVRQKLLDLSKRNRLLNFKETARSIRIINGIPEQAFKTLVTETKGMSLLYDEGGGIEESSEISQGEFAIRANDSIQFDKDEKKQIDQNQHYDLNLQTPYTATILERRCGRLLKDARTAIEETGSNFLFLSIGFLEWYEDDESDISYRAPLILIPVQLERGKIDKENNCYTYKLSYTEEDIETNLSLALKISKDFGITLPELDDQVEPSKYLGEISRLIKHKRRWHVVNDMVIGMFSFAKIVMYKDLDPEKWPTGFFNITEHEKIKEVLKVKETFTDTNSVIYGNEHEIDGNKNAEKIPLILDADSSQHSVIIDALDNKDIVVEGPPGTGKSQTIANLIAAALYEGKAILFVAEKKAALEVVRRRLDKAGLGDFCLELHSTKTQKGKLREDIKKRIERYFKRPEELKYLSEDLARERDKLRGYMNLINKVAGPSGEKIYEIMWKAERWRTELPDGQITFFSIENALSLTRSNIQDRITALTEFVHLFNEIPQSTLKIFSGFKPTNVYPGDEHSLKSLLLNFIEATEDITTFLDSVISNHEFPFDKTLGEAISISEINNSLLANVPENFEQAIVSKMVNSIAVRAIYKLRDDIALYNNLKATVENYLREYHSLSVDRATEMNKALESIESLGYGDRSLVFIDNIITESEKAIKLLLELKTIADSVQGILIEEINELSHFSILVVLLDTILNAPPDMEMYKHTAHISPAVPQIFKKVKDKAVELNSKINNFATFFHLSRLPNYTNLRQIATDLKQYSGSFFSFLSPTLRKIRRTISGFAVDEVSVKQPQMGSKLYEIADLLEKAERMASDLEHQRVLGHLFKGIDTEWDCLESHIVWAQSLRAIVDSQSFAEKIIDNISRCRDLSSKFFVKTKNIVEEIDSILEKLLIVKQDVSLAMHADGSVFLECVACKTQNKFPANRLMDKPLCGKCKTPLNVSRLSVDEAITKNQKLIEQLRAALEMLVPFVVNEDITIKEIAAALNKYFDADHTRKLVDGNYYCKEHLGSFFKGIETDVHCLCSLADWTNNILHNRKMPDKVAEWALADETPQRLPVLADCITKIKDYLTLHANVLNEIKKLGEIDEKEFFGQNIKDAEISKLRTKYNKCVEQLDYVFLWNDYCKTKDKAIQLGLSDVISAIENRHVAPEGSISTLTYGIYNSMARELVRKEPSLSSFTTASYENIRARFIELDRKIMGIVREEIAFKISQRHVPQGNGIGPVSTYTDMALIKLELNKRKRHIPTRQLIRRAGAALNAQKPCFMMSPLSVAQYLEPGKVVFDLVVMDEASQIKPEDALGAFARGSRVVVVGDSNQLPPTTFFDRINESYDEDETMAIEDTESILDISRTIYKPRRLRWHYRSEHESLISFSNREFYDEDLIVFPSPIRSNDQLGIRCHYIKDAAYSKGRNLTEAQAIVNAIINHFEDAPDVSLGVATFNREQRDLIEDLLDKKRKQDHWLDNIIKESEEKEEPFFIKNLENVQGDERDAIFISFTYGPDQSTRKVYQRFGPIGNEAGWRRLNVIFTRAKKRVEVFTSMLPTDLIITDSTPRGVRVLRDYLDYALNGRSHDYGKISKKEPGSDFEVAVARILNSFGYKTAFQVGVAGYFIDLGVVHPQRESDFILGVECDGATYHSGKSVRDRDRLRQEILERKGWQIHRIWSTDWFKNRDKEIERLIKTLKQIEEKDKIIISTIKQEPQKISRIHLYVPDTPIVKNDDDLRRELIDYRKVNIEPKYTNQSNGILRDEMVEAFVRFKPTTKEEFLACIPYNLRNNISLGQGQFLNGILQIIEEYL
jgi:very-short-patch-repair endonuclease